MPITMSGATIEDDERQALLNEKVEGITGGVKANVVDIVASSAAASGLNGTKTGRNIAGVTAQFATHFETACTAYITKVKNDIAKIEAVDASVAFQGTALKGALERFIESVKKVANNFADSLEKAENQIIQSVASAYRTQDTDVAKDLNADSSNLSA